MKLHQHILEGYDAKLVGTEDEIERYRRDVYELATLLDEVQWSANLGQNTHGCPICCAEYRTARPYDPAHFADCKLAAALKKFGFAPALRAS
jgi:hypothetical protein